MQSLYTSLSALKSSMNWLDRLSNNLSNIDTPGFAQNEGSFADMYTALVQGNPTTNAVSGRYTPPGWWGGTGVLSVSNESDFSQMPMNTTNNPTDMAIQGNGFFLVQGPQGDVLTKAGNFAWSATGDGRFRLSTPDGYPVLDVNHQPIYANSNKQQFTVGPNGQITFGTTSGPRIALVEVPVPNETLSEAGNNTYSVRPDVLANVTNGNLIVNKGNGTPTSTVVQGALSMSNVDMTKSMTDMIQAQRMFDLNSEAIQMTNKMMGIANSIRA